MVNDVHACTIKLNTVTLSNLSLSYNAICYKKNVYRHSLPCVTKLYPAGFKSEALIGSIVVSPLVYTGKQAYFTNLLSSSNITV